MVILRQNSVVMAGDVQVVKYYIAYRLRRAGYSWPTGEAALNLNGIENSEHIRIMKLLGAEFEQAYFNSFEDMNGNINIQNRDDAHTAYLNVANTLFEQGIQWGRIVGLIVFASKLSLAAAQLNKYDRVDDIVQWTTDYLNSPRFLSWRAQNQGWRGFVEYYKRPENRNQQQNGEHFPWRGALGVGIAAIAGGAAVMNFLMNRH